MAPERVISNLAEYGNTSAASIPLALDEAVRGGSIQSGDTVRSSASSPRTPSCIRSHQSPAGWNGMQAASISRHRRLHCAHNNLDANQRRQCGCWLHVQIAMAGFGAGLTWASAIVKWG